MCGGSVSLLVIEGEVEEAVLQEAWSDIVQEFSGLIQTQKSAGVFEAFRKMAATRCRMEFMELALKEMRAQWEEGEGHNQELAELIMLHGYTLIEDRDNDADYLRQLDAVEMESRSLVVFFNQYKAEYEALAPKGESRAEERDRMSYEKELNLLSKHQGHHIDAEAITVLKYASYINYFLEANKPQPA